MLDSAAARESAMLGWDFSKMQLPLSHSCSCLDRAPLCSAGALYIWGKQILLTSSYRSRTPHYTPQNPERRCVGWPEPTRTTRYRGFAMTSNYSTLCILHDGNMIRRVSSSLANIALEIFLHIHTSMYKVSWMRKLTHFNLK